MRISDWSSDVCASDLCQDGLRLIISHERIGSADRAVLHVSFSSVPNSPINAKLTPETLLNVCKERFQVISGNPNAEPLHVEPTRIVLHMFFPPHPKLPAYPAEIGRAPVRERVFLNV